MRRCGGSGLSNEWKHPLPEHLWFAEFRPCERPFHTSSPSFLRCFAKLLPPVMDDHHSWFQARLGASRCRTRQSHSIRMQKSKSPQGNSPPAQWPCPENAFYRQNLHLSVSVNNEVRTTSIEFDDIRRLEFQPPPLNIRSKILEIFSLAALPPSHAALVGIRAQP
jgi:hypothetical protein